MCENCGCGEGGGYTILNPSDHSHIHGTSGHDHDHVHDHTHDHLHESGHQRIKIETDVLHQNNLLAQRNRGYFEAKNIMCINLVSSPGSGKTTILERTIRAISNRKVYVIEGDQQTSLDAERIQATGVPVLQVNTGTGCHLDASMINHAVKNLNPENGSLLLIENVGNLVCPALFDLGENYRIIIMSVTEGEDKPLKYPHIFSSSSLCLINKTDLLPYLDFDVEVFKTNALKINQNLEFIELSARSGDSFMKWVERLLR